MHTYITYFRGFVVGSQSLLTWGFCPGSSRAPTSLCRRRRAAVSKISGGRGGGGERFLTWRILTGGFVRGRAVRRLHCVSGRAPVNFGRRRRRGGKIGGGGGAARQRRGAARRPPKKFPHISLFP